MDAISESTRQALLLRVRGHLCVLPLAHVVEIMRPLRVSAITGQSPALLGIAIHRGAPVPVVDVAALIGATALAQPGRFVALKLGARVALLAVDEVLGTRDLSEATAEALPALLGEAAKETLSEIGRLDEELLFVLRAARFVRNDVWPTNQTVPAE